MTDMHALTGLLFIVGLLAFARMGSVTVYDCSPSSRLSYTLLDLTGPQQCSNPKDDYSIPTNVSVQVLHTDTAVPVEAYQCVVTITKMVVGWGYDSLTYAHHHDPGLKMSYCSGSYCGGRGGLLGCVCRGPFVHKIA